MMCDLYSITTNQPAIIALFRVVNRYVGAPMPGVFPDYKALIVRNGAEGRELATARWGMPSSQHVFAQPIPQRRKDAGNLADRAGRLRRAFRVTRHT
jgi:putative SOS response-associated peptidase YedK